MGRNTGKNNDRGSKVRNRDKGRAVRTVKPFRAVQESKTQEFYVEDGYIFGRNPVMEAIKSGRSIEKIVAIKNGEGSIIQILGKARDANIQVQYLDRKILDRMSGMQAHQGIGAKVAAYEYVEVEDILAKAEAKGEEPFIVILDEIEDPHNLGAIMRSCDACGVHGIIIPKNRAVGITETVVKSSAGAVEYVPCAKVGNLVRTVKQLQEKGIWVATLDMDGEIFTRQDMRGGLAIVVGSEGRGVGRLIKESADFNLSIPMRGKVNSLNASNACCVVLYEAMMQRNGMK